MRRTWLGLLCLLSTPVLAQTTDPSEASNGDFGAKLLTTDDPDGFWREWNQPENPTVSTTSRVTQARPVYAIIVFHDCRAGADGKCKVTAHFDITDPDGKPYDEPRSATAWSEAPAPNHNLQASLASIGFRLEPQDKLGRYEIKATLTDEVAGRRLTLRQSVSAEAEQAGGPAPIS